VRDVARMVVEEAVDGADQGSAGATGAAMER
jgi:hypothetical protein